MVDLSWSVLYLTFHKGVWLTFPVLFPTSFLLVLEGLMLQGGEGLNKRS